MNADVISSKHADAMGALGLLGGVTVGIVIILACLLAGPFVLQSAIKWVTKYKIKFGDAVWVFLKVAFISAIVSFLFVFVVLLLLTLAVGLDADKASTLAQLLNLVLAFFFQSWLYGIFVQIPDQGKIGFKKGALVWLTQISIVLVFVLVVVLLAVLAGFITTLLSH